MDKKPGAAWHCPAVSWKIHGLPTDGRRVTTGAAGGGQSTKQKKDGEEAIGGERDYVRANCTEVHWNCTEGQRTRMNLGGGRGGDQSHLLRTGKEVP